MINEKMWKREVSGITIYTIKQPIHSKSIYEELIKERTGMKKVKINLVSETITTPDLLSTPIVAITGEAVELG